jgi:hypothetical protein
MPKETRLLVDALRRQAWTVVHNRKHIKAYPPCRDFPMVTFGSTPSDHRAMKNTISQLRKSGFDTRASK